MKNRGYLYNVNPNLLITEPNPLNEYPRPGLAREKWTNLNGLWDFTISKENKLTQAFTQKIVVPFAVESPLSGVHKLIEPDDYMIYQKKIKFEHEALDKYIVIHFEGIDQVADVYLDGKFVKHHEGISRFSVMFKAKEEVTLTVIVNDKTDLAYFARGKQTLNPLGHEYNSSSGIIKTVWYEAVDEVHISDIKFYPDYDKRMVGVLVKANTNEQVCLKINQETFEVTPNRIFNLPINYFHAWSNDDPYLYTVKATLPTDEVISYFGIRKIDVQEVNGKKRLCLNNKPVFFSGILFQGYYYLGDLTPRNYNDMVNDLKRIKELGFNTVRVHAKVEGARFYYMCDQMGIFVIQDFPNGGGRYKKKMIKRPRFFRHLTYRSLDLKGTGRSDPRSQEIFMDEVNYYLDHFNNNPSVIMYTIFNEAWGEFKPSEIYKHCKELDHNLHLFDTTSGWLDCPDSDVFSIHTYAMPGLKRIDKHNRPFIISNTGGLGYKVYKNSLFDGYYAHRPAQDLSSLAENYEYLGLHQLLPQINKYGLNMVIYTQYCDCESEFNGLYTFDRQVLKIDRALIERVNKAYYNEFYKATKPKKVA